MNTRATNTAVALLLLGLPFACSLAQGSGKASGSSTNATGTNAVVVTNVPAYLEVQESDLYLNIEDAGLTFDVGRQVFLFQQNDVYICLMTYGDGETRLCAFPRTTGRGQGTGWVTNEKFLFFGVRTRSVEGRFYFDEGERLAVVFETNGYRRVAIERYGRKVEVDLPDDYPGMKYIPAPEPVQVAEPPPMPAKPSPKPAKPSPKEEPRVEEALPVKPEMTTGTPVEETLIGGFDEVPEGGMEPIESLAGDSAPPAADESLTFKQRMSAMISRHLWLLELLLALAILGAIPIIIKRNKASLLTRSTYAKPPPAPSFSAPPSAAPPPPPPMNMPLDEDEAVTAVESQITKKSGDEFTGSLEAFTMGDLIQFVHSTTKTGALEIQSDEAPGQNCLIFELGEIIDAVYGDKRGEDAVYSIVRIKKGTYNFSREARSGVTKTVDKSTMSLLLDAHRIMDEEGSAPPVPEPEKVAKPEPPKTEPEKPAPKKKRQKLTMK